MNGWWVAGLLAVVLGAAATTGWEPLLPVTYLLVLLVGVGLAWSRVTAHGLDLRCELAGDRVECGGVLLERLTLRNRAPLPALWVSVVDEGTLPDRETGRIVVAPARRAVAWTVRTLCNRRGAYVVGPALLTTSDPFGLFAATRRAGSARSVLVLPATDELPAFVPPTRELPGGARTRASGVESSPQVSGVRDYVPGDPLNRVHWPSTARTGRLMVKELEHEPTADVWIALDLDESVHIGAGDQSTEEYAVRAAASIARRCLEAGRTVGLAMQSQRHVIVQPDRGERQLGRILTELAVARARGREPFDGLLRSDALRPDRDAALIAITPAVDTAWPAALAGAGAHGARAIAVVVEPSTFGGRLSAQPAIAELTSAGIQTYVLRRGDRLASSLGHG